MIGNRIGGRYEIIRNIGEGGMSKVYLAHDIILDRDVAIKVLNYDFANEEELKRRFKREAQSATSLTHPNIVDIFDVGEEGELHYLVMEYIEGQTLKKFIQMNGPLAPKQAVPIMRQLVSAISNAHQNGIVHRDIKPQNILMDADGDVKITDFGIAMALSATAHTKTNSVIGTVHYLSPEQARGGMATKKSDIYSLGIVFYELLTGELPFSAETAVAIALKHLQEETPSVRALIPTIPQSVENVILKATTKDASHRYRSADEMYDDLLTVLSPERAHEARFVTPFDDDKTRAIPIVRESSKFENVEETKKMEAVVPEKVPEPAKKRRKGPIIAASIAGVVVLLLLILLLPSLLGLKKAVVPNVVGLEETEAVDLLTEEKFKVGDRKEQASDEYEAGQVIRTIPEADQKRDVGSSVTLFISTGKETKELADYTGDEYDQVVKLLDGYGFKSIEPEEEYNDAPKGTIIRQEPKANPAIVPSETDLLFTVSLGPEVRTVDSLLGFDNKQLTKYAKTSGFDVRIVGEKESASVPVGQVISQQPVAGEEIAKGGEVNVVVSKGPPKKPVKYIVQTVTIEYEPEDEEEFDEEEEQRPERVPQQIQLYIQDRTKSMADPVEVFTITETTVKKITIELEEGQRGAYRIMRDGKTLAEKTFDYKDGNYKDNN